MDTDDGWPKVWAEISDEELPDRLCHYLFLAANGRNPMQDALPLLAKQPPITGDNAQKHGGPPPALTTVVLLKFGKTCVGYSDEFRNPDKRILASQGATPALNADRRTQAGSRRSASLSLPKPETPQWARCRAAVLYGPGAFAPPTASGIRFR